MSRLVDWALGRMRMMLVLILLSVAAGLGAYLSLPREGSPEVDIPNLYVSVPLPGGSASDIERLVLKPLEQEVRDLETLKQVDTFAVEGHGGALLEFESGWDKAARLADLRDRVDRARAEMPDAIEEPTISEISLSEVPVLVIAISGDAPERVLLRAAQEMKREIETLGGVLEAELTGARDEVFEALLDPAKMEALKLSPEVLGAVVRGNNKLVAAGALEQGDASAPVSLPGSLEKPSDAGDLPLIVQGDRIVRLSDVAEIRRGFEDAEGFARFNGHPTLALQIKKRGGANIIDTVAAVREKAAAAQAAWPEPLRQALSVGYMLDLSAEVRDMVSQLENSVATAVLLVMAVVAVSLGARSALLVGFAVPTSFLLAFALFGLLGYSVDNMVMFGLILSVGMLVDGAIVVAELGDRRIREGFSPQEAYAGAARRMFWPIVSSTATTLSAFLPMLFWPGLAGEFMRLLPITLIFVLSASLAAALIFLPVIGALIGRLAETLRLARRRPPAPRRARRSLYGRAIRALIASPLGALAAIGAAIGAVVFAFALYSEHDKGVEFFVQTEPQRAVIYVRAVGDFSAREKDRLVRQVERRVAEVDGVGDMFAFSGTNLIALFGSETPQDAVGQLQIELEPWAERAARGRRGEAVLDDIRAAVADIPGVTPELRKMEDSPSQGKPVQLFLSGGTPERLSAAVDAAREAFAKTPGLRDIDDTRPLPGLQWRLEVDRAMAGRYGADVERVGAMVSMATRGLVLDQSTPEDSLEAIDVVARLTPAARTLDALDGLRVATDQGLTPLSNFVRRVAEPATGSIARRDGERFFLVRADVTADANPTDRIAAVAKELKRLAAERPEILAGLDYKFVGESEDQAETEAFLVWAMIGALGLIFVILLAQFDSFYNAALVLSAVAMSIGGVLIGMVVMDQSFSIIMTGVGVVALAGIVVNNNIVLIDTYQDYARHMNPLEAVARTAEDRLRPVLLTTITTMAGLAPMTVAASFDFASLSISVGAPSALWWVQLSTAVVFGLGFATILTLIATPAALAARIWARIYGRRALTMAFGSRRAATRALEDARLRESLPRGPVEIDWTATGGATGARPDRIAAE